MKTITMFFIIVLLSIVLVAATWVRPQAISYLFDTLGDTFSFVEGNKGYLNMTAFDKRYSSGGYKSFYFSNLTSDVAGMYIANLTIPSANGLIINTANDGETILAEFISEPITQPYIVLEGSRFFHILAKVNNVAKITQLRGYVYTANLTGGNQQLLRNSTLSLPLTVVEAEYVMSVCGGNLIINTTQRIIFKIVSIKQVGGILPVVTLHVGDESFSRLDVPAPSPILTDNQLLSYDDAGKISISNGNTIDISTNNGISYFNNVVVSGNVSIKRPYGMFSDNTTQVIPAALTAYPVNFSITENAYEIIKTGMDNFTFQQTGNYLIEVSAIVNVDLPTKHVELWVEKNGKAVPRSNTKVEITSATTETVIAVPFIISMMKNDTMRIMWASDDAGSSMVFTPNTSYSPSSPSIIMTITKISEIP